MAFANLRREFLRVPTSTTIPATGASQVRCSIPLRSNTRLVKIEPHLNLTVSAAMAARTTSFDMENFVRYADNGLRLGGLKGCKRRPVVPPRDDRATHWSVAVSKGKWSGRQDLNLRHLGPKPSALPG